MTEVPAFPYYAKGMIHLCGTITPLIDAQLRLGKLEGKVVPLMDPRGIGGRRVRYTYGGFIKVLKFTGGYYNYVKTNEAGP